MQENSNTNINTEPIVPAQAQPSLPVQPVGDVTMAPTLVQNPPVAPPTPAPEVKKSKFPKKILFITLGIVFLIIIIVIIAVFATKGLKGVTDLIPMASGSPAPTPFVEVIPASPYENDPEVLKIKADLEAFDAKLNQTSVREDTLRIPVLEWTVDFKK